MEEIGGYILRVCCSALIASVVLTIGPDGAGSKIRQMICGLFLTFVVISPLRQIQLDDLWQLPDSFYQEGQDIAASAQASASEEISDIIITQTRTYILDEASSLGLQIEVKDIQLDPGTLEPIEVEIWGDISPYNRTLLSDYLQNTLGIGKEGQLWMR